jgi:hypothetical protein
MKVKTVLLCMVLTVVLAASTAADAQKESKDDYKKQPGYVDFDALEIFGEENSRVEVHLKQPMLKLVSEFVKVEEPELFELLGKLSLVRVEVFESNETAAKKFIAQSSKTFKTLEGKGWERIVRVSEDDENVHVYMMPSKDYDFLRGIFVIALEDDDEAVFVNIVGDIHPQDIGRLGHYFGIEELDRISYEKKKGN